MPRDQPVSGVAELLDQLDARNLPWGIVTNKPARFTIPLMQELGLSSRAACVVSGGDTAHSKPHPAPLFAASAAISIAPADCIYLGDDIRDVQASLAAGMEPSSQDMAISAAQAPLNRGAPDTLSTGRRNCSVISDSPFLL